MRLTCKDEVTIHHGDLAVVLRPSLRAAMTLERLHAGGWPELLRKIEEFDTATIKAILRAAAVDRSALEALFRAFSHRPLAELASAVLPPLGELLSLFLAPDDDQDERPAPSVNARPWKDAYSELFKIGTGWLAWTPATTWAATLPEIEQAQRGNLDQLRAIHGGSDQDDSTDQGTSNVYTAERLREIEALGHDPAFDRAAAHKLKAMM